MLRTTVEVSENSEIDAVLELLQHRAVHAGLPPASQVLLREQTLLVMEPLFKQGNRIAALGSHMHVERELNGDDFAIRFVYRIGDKPSLPRRLLRLLRSH